MIVQRVIIRSLIDSGMWQNEGVDFSEWLQTGIQENWWGLPIRWKVDIDCTQEEISSALDSRYNELSGFTEYQIPAQYTIEFIDITEEVKARRKLEVAQQLTAQWDVTIKALMSGADFVTRLGEAVAVMDMAANLDESFTPEQVAYGKSLLPGFRSLMAQVQSMRTQRDVEIAAAQAAIDAEFENS